MLSQKLPSPRKLVFGLVLFLFFLNALLHIDWAEQETRLGPEGFRQNVKSLGVIETAFEGPISILAEDRIEQSDGTISRVPAMRIQGHDPSPEDDSMRLFEVHVVAFGDKGIHGIPRYEIHGPSALLPTDSASNLLSLDRTLPWVFEKPTLVFPAMTDGKDFTLEAEMAFLSPLSGIVRCKGAYTLSSPGLLIQGVDITLNPKDRAILFGQKNGNTEWSVELEPNIWLTGNNDGGGRFYSDQKKSWLELHAKKKCLAIFPENSTMPGTLHTNGLQLELAGTKSGWAPQKLDALTPTQWQGKSEHLIGNQAQLTWKENTAHELVIRGPVSATFFRREEQIAKASQQAVLDSKTGDLELWGKVHVQRNLGSLRADWAKIHAKTWEAKGQVHYQGEEGELFADEAFSRPFDGIFAKGNAAAHPSKPGLDILRASTIQLTPNGNLQVPQRFRLEGRDEGNAWSVEANSLETRPTSEDIHSLARGEVIWQRGELIARGDELLQRGGRRSVLTGKAKAPAHATFPLEEGLAKAEAMRFVLSGETLHLQGKPSLSLPAKAIGLSGDHLFIHAKFINRLENGQWEFIGNVHFTGALQGEAKRALWTPQDSLFFLGEDRLLRFEGERLDGSPFQVFAKEVTFFKNGNSLLAGDAEIHCHPRRAQSSLQITAHTIQFTESGGKAEGQVQLTTSTHAGEAARIDWQRPSPEQLAIQLQENAHLICPEGEVFGDHINYEPQAALLRAQSENGAQAKLLLKDGREILSPWIHFDMNQRLLSTGKATVSRTLP